MLQELYLNFFKEFLKGKEVHQRPVCQWSLIGGNILTFCCLRMNYFQKEKQDSYHKEVVGNF